MFETGYENVGRCIVIMDYNGIDYNGIDCDRIDDSIDSDSSSIIIE